MPSGSTILAKKSYLVIDKLKLRVFILKLCLTLIFLDHIHIAYSTCLYLYEYICIASLLNLCIESVEFESHDVCCVNYMVFRIDISSLYLRVTHR